MLFSELWAIEANAIYAVYWLFVSCLRDPANWKAINNEIDAVRQSWQAKHSGVALSAANFGQFMKDVSDQLPLLTSGLQETLRLYSSVFSIRRVAVPTEFAGYEFNVGEKIICATRSVHMDDEIYEYTDDEDNDDGVEHSDEAGTSDSRLSSSVASRDEILYRFSNRGPTDENNDQDDESEDEIFVPYEYSENPDYGDDDI